MEEPKVEKAEETKEEQAVETTLQKTIESTEKEVQSVKQGRTGMEIRGKMVAATAAVTIAVAVIAIFFARRDGVTVDSEASGVAMDRDHIFWTAATVTGTILAVVASFVQKKVFR